MEAITILQRSEESPEQQEHLETVGNEENVENNTSEEVLETANDCDVDDDQLVQDDQEVLDDNDKPEIESEMIPEDAKILVRLTMVFYKDFSRYENDWIKSFQ